MIFSTESARATLLQRGDASRGSSTESARATELQRDDASRGSSTESARATLLKRGDAPRGSSTEPARATCRREMMLGEGALAAERCRGTDLEEATWEVRPGAAEGAWEIGAGSWAEAMWSCLGPLAVRGWDL